MPVVVAHLGKSGVVDLPGNSQQQLLQEVQVRQRLQSAEAASCNPTIIASLHLHLTLLLLQQLHHHHHHQPHPPPPTTLPPPPTPISTHTIHIPHVNRPTLLTALWKCIFAFQHSLPLCLKTKKVVQILILLRLLVL